MFSMRQQHTILRIALLDRIIAACDAHRSIESHSVVNTVIRYEIVQT